MEIEKNKGKINLNIPKEKKENLNKGIWKKFFILIYKAKLPYFWILLSLTLLLFSSKLGLLLPQYTGKLMDGDISSSVVFGVIAIEIINQLNGAVSQFINNGAMARISYKMRMLMWKTFMKLPADYYDKNKAREMISRTTKDTDNLSSLIINTFISFIAQLYTVVNTIIIIKNYDHTLAASMLVFIPLVLIFSFVLGRLNFYANSNVYKSIAKLTQFLAELINNIPLIKSFANEEKEEQRGKDTINKLYSANIKKGVIESATGVVGTLLSTSQTLAIILLGVMFISSKKLGVGTWVAYYMYANNLVGIINSQMDTWLQIKVAQGSTEKISRIVEEPWEEYKKAISLEGIEEDIHFKNVYFRYEDKDVLSDVSIDIPYGKVTAIVGSSGGGKSTIANLLERLYKPVSGKITIGDKSIEEYDLKEWRKAFGYVSQDNSLMSGTIRENILYGTDRKISEEEFNKAAELANVTEFVKGFPEGFDKEVGEFGSKLSGGQKQRIAIARAIIRNPKFLLLDEATSNLDACSENAVQKGLNNLMKGRTTIVIAHKLAEAASADNIIVVDSGTISGAGTHEELLKSNKLYKQFVEIQMGQQAG